MKYVVVIMFSVSLGLSLISLKPAVAETCGGMDFSCCDQVLSTSDDTCAIPANNKYIFTLRRFGFENSAGEVTWVGTETAFNAANADIGATMGNFVTGENLPEATYVALRPEVKLEMTVNGDGVSTADGVPCTSGGDQTESLATVSEGFGTPIPSCSTSPNENCDTGDGYKRIRTDMLGDFTITSTSSRTIEFTFDAGGGVLFDTGGGACTYRSIGLLAVDMSFSD